MNTRVIYLLLIFMLTGCVDQEKYDLIRYEAVRQSEEISKLKSELKASNYAFKNMNIALSTSYSEKLTILKYCEWIQRWHLNDVLNPVCSALDESLQIGWFFYQTLMDDARQSDEFKRFVEIYSVGYNPVKLIWMQFLTVLAFAVLLFIPLFLLWLVTKTAQYKALKHRCISMTNEYNQSKEKLSDLEDLAKHEDSLIKSITEYEALIEEAKSNLYDINNEIDQHQAKLESLSADNNTLEKKKADLISQCEVLGLKIQVGDNNIF